MGYQKGVKSGWGHCDHELRSKVPEWMYDAVIYNGPGADKSETVRAWVGQHLVGRLQVVTGRPTEIDAQSPDQAIQAQISEQMRDHLAALAILEGMSVEEYLSHVIRLHLYGVLGSKVAEQADAHKREVGER